METVKTTSKATLTAITNENIIKAFKYIDDNGVPGPKSQKKYEVFYKGKGYPAKHLLSVAHLLQNGSELDTESFTTEDARNLFKDRNFKINPLGDFQLTITKDSIVSTDARFTMDDLTLGDYYMPTWTYFERHDGSVIYRKRSVGEKILTGQTMPRTVFQVFENQIEGLSLTERREFPICRYKPNKETIKGIFSSIEESNETRNSKSFENMSYERQNGEKFVIYCWNIFSTVIFVQECLKRFGVDGDKVVLFYKEKEKGASIHPKTEEVKEEYGDGDDRKKEERKHPLNQILYGPPGTGKTYNTVIYAVAICENKNINEVEIEKYDDVLKTYKGYKDNGLIEFITFHQSYGYEEFIQGIKPSVNDKEQVVYKIEDGIFKAFCDKAKNNPNQNYVFIIDEINRGNVSKIFGELITLIEESKRISENNPDQGMTVKLPYNSEEFGVPENVYLLGTMNTADRSLVQLDAALRRRFRFIEMMPKYNVLSDDADGINVQELLKAINKQIREKIDREHQIGHSYFIDVTTEAQLKETFENEIIPLLQEYFYENYESIKEILGGQDFTDEEEKIDLSSFDFKKIYEKTND